MKHIALKTKPIPETPTPRTTALFLHEPHSEMPEVIEEWDEEDDLTFVTYYSPTSD